MKTLMTSKRLRTWSALVAIPLLAACGGKAYYTRDVDHEDGHLRFTDKATGDEVILDNAEVREITRQQLAGAVGAALAAKGGRLGEFRG